MKKEFTYLIVEFKPNSKEVFDQLGIPGLRIEGIRELPDGSYVLPWDQDKKAMPDVGKDIKTKIMTEDQLLKEIEKQEKALPVFDHEQYLSDNDIDWYVDGILQPKKPKKV